MPVFVYQECSFLRRRTVLNALTHSHDSAADCHVSESQVRPRDLAGHSGREGADAHPAGRLSGRVSTRVHTERTSAAAVHRKGRRAAQSASAQRARLVLRRCAAEMRSGGFATQVMCAKLRVSAQVSFEEIGKATPGFVGADLSALVKEAAIAAVREYFEYSLVRAPPVPVSHLVCSIEPTPLP